MSSLVEKIERYIKQVLNENPHGFIIIQRSDLASQFECAPSQINYVLSTRFSVEQGYVIESRRGGGGYLRIIKLGIDIRDYLDNMLGQLIGAQLSQPAAEGLLKRLHEEDLLSRREVMLLRAMLDKETIELAVPERDQLRARLMAALLRTLARKDF